MPSVSGDLAALPVEKFAACESKLLPESTEPRADDPPENSREIPGYDGRYRITPTGEVWSCAVLTGNHRIHDKNGAKWMRLKTTPGGTGYLKVTLTKNTKEKTYNIHRILAELFIPGDHSLVVNHIDMNKTNNALPNLEWVTMEENIQKAHASSVPMTRAIPIVCINPKTKEVRTFASISKATKSVNIKSPSICKALKTGKTSKGLIFKYQ